MNTSYFQRKCTTEGARFELCRVGSSRGAIGLLDHNGQLVGLDGSDKPYLFGQSVESAKRACDNIRIDARYIAFDVHVITIDHENIRVVKLFEAENISHENLLTDQMLQSAEQLYQQSLELYYRCTGHPHPDSYIDGELETGKGTQSQSKKPDS